MTGDQPMYSPSRERIAQSAMYAFARAAEKQAGVALPDYKALHRWSVENREQFWSLLWDFCAVKASAKGDRVLVDGDKMPGSQWFPDARLNYAENLLQPALTGKRDKAAIHFWGEDKVKQTLSFGDVHDRTAALAAHLRAQGVKPGDRVAALVANTPEAVIAMLATSAVGATFSSCSPDFGERLILDRFTQIEPKVLIATDSYYYKGKVIDVGPKIRIVAEALPGLKQIIVASYINEKPQTEGLPNAISWQEAAVPGRVPPLAFEQLPFAHPLFILYSSGTTGLPKCFVHSQGGVLLQHLKELHLQSDVKQGDVVFYHSTCGWMMWNWLVSSLAFGAALALYDGMPAVRDGNILFDFCDEAGFTLFGTSAPFVQAIKNMGLKPKKTHSMKTVRLLTSTGAPLLPEHFDYLYADVLRDVPVASISGGSDIVSCFVLGNPLSPVWRGEIQGPGLGLDMAVYDESGKASTTGAGELVCRRSFPCMPVAFWNDPDGAKYRAAYFERFPGVWCHGDWTEMTRHGGLIIYGRSDATTNRQGVRIGTGEFYNLVEQLPEVENSLVASMRVPGDERIYMFVKLRAGVALDDALKGKIAKHMRDKGSPRHVPDEIHEAPDIPVTRNAKKAEMAVINMFQGRPVTNQTALANPESLGFFADFIKRVAQT
ncbi:MAG: acetoacetate--CoA ligase [Alphaproteobacteria bacterium]|nr:acetoacetate--CoA ligase [Alphaproteobacteria bacterium]